MTPIKIQRSTEREHGRILTANSIMENTRGCIDLNGRRMWYQPWPVDAGGSYRAPSAIETEQTYAISGEAIAETLEWFITCNGSVEELVNLLNSHVPDDRFVSTPATLSDPTRWYTNEYSLYISMFCKRLLGRASFHYGESGDEQLSVHHKPWEQGELQWTPWGEDETGRVIKEEIGTFVHGSYMQMLHIVPEEKQAACKRDFFAFVQAFLPERYAGLFDEKFFSNELLGYSYEFYHLVYAICTVLTNHDTMNRDITGFYFNNRMPSFFGMVLKSAVHLPIGHLFTNLLTRASSKLHIDVVTRRNTLYLKIRYSDSFFDKYRDYRYHVNAFRVNDMTYTGGLADILKFFIKMNEEPEVQVLNYNRFRDRSDYTEIVASWKPGRSFKVTWFVIAALLAIFGVLCIVFNPPYGLHIFVGISTLATLAGALVLTRTSRELAQREAILEHAFLKKSTAQVNIEALTEKLRREIEESYATSRASEMKTSFFINIAHETRTPLTLISNYLDAYITRKGTDRDLEVLKNNVEKLTKTMVDYLDSEKT
jgi:hypothetical protein